MCTDLAIGVESLEDVLNGTCANGECVVVDGSPLCRCDFGWRDEFCDREAKNLKWNYLFAIGLPIVILAALVFYAKKRTGETFTNVPARFVTQSPWGSVSTTVLFYYRSAVFIGWLGLHISQLQSRVGFIYRTFTVISSTLFMVTFLLGALLSLKALDRQPEGNMSDPGNLAYRVFWVAEEVLISATVLICLVVWLILLPALSANGQPEVVVNLYSFFQHGINVLLIVIDFYLNSLHVELKHGAFVLIYAAAYALLHGLLMGGRDARDKPVRPIYFFLSLENGTFLVWLIGLILIIVLFHLVSFGLSKLKMRIVGQRIEVDDEKKISA